MKMFFKSQMLAVFKNYYLKIMHLPKSQSLSSGVRGKMRTYRDKQEDRTYHVQPWLVWLSGLSARLRTKGSLVRFPVRAHAWVAG